MHIGDSAKPISIKKMKKLFSKGTNPAEIYLKLFNAYGEQHWWPGDTPWEVCTGAVLTQNTAWRNVEIAIGRLKNADMLSPEKILFSEDSVIERLIASSGYFRLKTQRLKAVCRWWTENVRDDRLHPARKDLDYWRESILSVKGVGPETADSILLYSFNLPTFVIDAYTKRIMARHFKFSPDIPYEELRSFFMDRLPPDYRLFNEFHALFVRLGKEACRKNHCTEKCPL